MIIEQNSLHNNHLSELSLCAQLPIFKVKVKVTELYPTLCDPMDYTVHGVLQVRILEWVSIPFSMDFPNPGIESRSPTCRWILYQLSPQGNPRILEWVAYLFSSGSSRPRN